MELNLAPKEDIRGDGKYELKGEVGEETEQARGGRSGDGAGQGRTERRRSRPGEDGEEMAMMWGGGVETVEKIVEDSKSSFHQGPLLGS